MWGTSLHLPDGEIMSEAREVFLVEPGIHFSQTLSSNWFCFSCLVPVLASPSPLFHLPHVTTVEKCRVSSDFLPLHSELLLS